MKKLRSRLTIILLATIIGTSLFSLTIAALVRHDVLFVRDKVNYLDTRFKYLVGSLLLLKDWRRAVNLPLLLGFGLGLVINGITQQIEDSSESFLADRYFYRSACINGIHTSDKTIGAAHGDTAHDIVTDMLRYLDNELLAVVVNLNSIEQVGQIFGSKSYIQNRADYLHYCADILICHLRLFPFL